ncbi:acetyl/propionyl/methylcrotonyl-CoA carboxylase subunit alpha [Rhizobium sp. LjRoot254]|uniref:acetyl/propionyl/methylcrotonyl-CoA carboxylase subunit alpha n=1 Tax=Rhizobium sp. LjRoot254 TaxID=3342297 RepID=UPI003ECD2941
MFKKILIANRGEIATRVIRTARRMGVETVAVYSEADRDAQHVALADDARLIGLAPARESYLDQRKVIAAALDSGAEAVHPGYGFLSENADFADACIATGLVFIGPPASASRAMGGKSEAKALMADAGVPLVPGYHGADQSPDVLFAEAADVGYPVLIKASAGGGGKGMRVAETPEVFAAELAGAKREAMASFGDDRMLIEKYLVRPRHVEVQVFADNHGNCYSLFERDCSIQRRHQKVIEEAPAPGLSPDLRKRMGEAAVAAAKAIGYSGAGTIEFLLDSRGEFYFMEMNTRLQVEHPVTEFITGLDLVEWQLRVASGERLPERWGNLAINGHAIETRIYAEDASNGFLPSTGLVSHLMMPEAGPHVRIDSGIRAGDRITVHYDPMIAKLIVWDKDRKSAVARMRRALADTAITGVTSNVGFLSRLVGLPSFEQADLDTGFIGRHEDALLAIPRIDASTIALASLGLLLHRRTIAGQQASASSDPSSPWSQMNGFRLNVAARETLRFEVDGKLVEPTAQYFGRSFRFEYNGTSLDIDGMLNTDGTLDARIGNRKVRGFFWGDGQRFDLFSEGQHLHIGTPDPMGEGGSEAAAGAMTAPMPGIIRAILATPGERVAKGTALIIMEAMKMEHTIRAPSDGVVDAFNCAEGAMTEAGTVLVSFTPEAA